MVSNTGLLDWESGGITTWLLPHCPIAIQKYSTLNQSSKCNQLFLDLLVKFLNLNAHLNVMLIVIMRA